MYQSLTANRLYLYRVIAPLVGLFVALLIGVSVGLFTLAEEQTSAAIANQVKLATGALKTHGEFLETGANDYGHWDEAVEAIVDKFDFEWVDGNIGMAGEDNYGLSMTFLLGPDNSTVYSRVGAKGGASDVNTHLQGGFKLLLDHWRQKDDRQGTISGLVLADDKLAMVAIAPLRPYTDTARQQYTGYAVVFVDTLDEEILGTIAHNFLLPDLRFETTDEPNIDRRASISLSAEDAARNYHLIWTPDRPGDQTLRTLGPVIGLIVLSFGVLAAFIMKHVLSTFRQLQDSEARAMHDTLTGLPNRLLLFDRLDRLVGTRRTVRPEAAVLYLDLDGFKTVNDTFGHDAGDAVLLEAAERLRQHCRDRDTVARLGGDEFVIVMPGITQREDITKRAEDIIVAMAAPFIIKGTSCQVGVSIGVATAPIDGVDCNVLLRKADAALYKAKSDGKGVVRFYEPGPSNGEQPQAHKIHWIA